MSIEEGESLKDFAIRRIKGMAKRAPMYAATKEGFIMQVWVLLEVAGVDMEDIRALAVRTTTNNGAVGFEPINPQFSSKVTSGALKLLKAL